MENCEAKHIEVWWLGKGGNSSTVQVRLGYTRCTKFGCGGPYKESIREESEHLRVEGTCPQEGSTLGLCDPEAVTGTPALR